MGLSTAAIQAEKISHHQMTQLFWLNVLLGSVLTLIVAAAAPFVSKFYGNDPRLAGVTCALAVTFVIGSLGTQHRALLNREMRFMTLGLTELAGFVAGMIAGIVMAAITHSYWSLVVMQVVQSIVMTITSWITAKWKPGLPAKGTGVSGMVKFGANLAGFNFVNYFARNLDNVLIGKKFGEAALGLYGKAYQLLMLPIIQISMPFSKVAIPTLSRLQKEPQRYRAFYRKGVMLLAMLGMPVVVLLFVSATETVRLFLGPQWGDAVPIFRVLAPAAFFGTFNMATAWVYTSLGRSDRQLRWGIFTSILTVFAFFIALGHGPVAVGGAFSIVYCGVTMGYPGFAYCFRGTPLKMSDMLSAIWRPVVASLAAGAIVFGLRHVMNPELPAAISLGIQSVAYGIAYLALWAILPGGLDLLKNIAGMAGDLKLKRWVPRSPSAPAAKLAPQVEAA